jgi:hypothetical protein
VWCLSLLDYILVSWEALRNLHKLAIDYSKVGRIRNTGMHIQGIQLMLVNTSIFLAKEHMLKVSISNLL